MMAGNPSWWSMNDMHPHDPHHQFVNSSSDDQHNFPVRSWSQLLLDGARGGLMAAAAPLNKKFWLRAQASLCSLWCGLGDGEEKLGESLLQHKKKIENREDQLVDLNPPSFPKKINDDDHVKQEVAAQSTKCQLYDDNQEFHHPNKPWPRQQVIPVSPVNQDQCSSEASSVQQSSAQPVPKVRKEKLGDRITALHQLVAPFGRTDTASVLAETIGYIKFLLDQTEALSSSYMQSTASAGPPHHPQHFDSQSRGVSDLRSRGLCLIPISCTQHIK